MSGLTSGNVADICSAYERIHIVTINDYVAVVQGDVSLFYQEEAMPLVKRKGEERRPAAHEYRGEC